MRSPNLSIEEFTDFLQSLQYDLNNFNITNLSEYCGQCNVDKLIPTILTGLWLVEKDDDGIYRWKAEVPDEDLAQLIRETSINYKNCSI